MKLAWLVLVGAAAGCSDPPPTTFGAINDQIFQRSCANFSVCHSQKGAKNAGNLNLATDPYKALINVESSLPLPMVQHRLLVKPFEPDSSFLLLKLQLPVDATDDGGYEESMPLGNPHLPDVDISGIRTWITMGALKN